MVRLSASEQAAKKNTDLKADPGYADLYIPRKEGDATGSSGMVNDLATGLTGTSATAETPEIAQAIQTAVGRPIKLGEATKLPGVSNVNGLYFQQNDAAPQVVDTKKNNRYANKLKESDAV